MSTVGLLQSSQTISPWNPSPRRTWQTCQPTCSTCYCAYNSTIRYLPGKEMALPDTLSQFNPCPGPDVLLDIAIHHACLFRERKEAFQQAFVSNPEMCTLTDMIITGWPNDIKAVPCRLRSYWQHCETLTIKDGLVLHGEALIVPPSERGRVLQQLHQFHQGMTKAQLFAHGCVFWPGINKAIEEIFWQCETCTQFQAQNAAAPLTPMPNPSHPWQKCTTDIFTLEGIDYLIWCNFYSKMILIQHLPSGQSNTVKVVLLLKEMFSEHGIPKVLCSDNSPQYASAQFTEFCTSWGVTHETSSPHYQQSNGFAEACVKSMKHALQHAKYSSTSPQLTLLVLWATPIDAKLPSPAQLLYQCQIRTTIPARICNTDPMVLQIHKQIDAHSDASKSQTDKWCKSLSPLYTGQPFVMYDTLHKIWIPATVLCVLPKDSYQVCTSNGMVYLPHEMTPSWMQCQAHWHYLRCHNNHTAGSCQTSHFCATACTCQACTTATASKTTYTNCPWSCPCACTYICSTQHSSCAALEIRPCQHHT